MKIVYSYYTIDILHIGHIRHMGFCKSLVGKDGVSIVGIVSDDAIKNKKGKQPIVGELERMEIAYNLKHNDYAVFQEDYSPIENIRKIRPDIVVESTDHNPEDVENVRKVIEDELNGRLVISPYYPNKSSSEIKKKIKCQ